MRAIELFALSLASAPDSIWPMTLLARSPSASIVQQWTAADADQLDAACAEVEVAAGQAGCELRRLVGQQAQAFAAAALPLGRGLK